MGLIKNFWAGFWEGRMVEPIEVKAYECPLCGYVIAKNREWAVKHANIPMGKSLPLGLVYGSSESEYYEVVFGEFIRRDHSVHNGTVLLEGKRQNSMGLRSGVDYGLLKKRLEEGNVAFLNEEEFERFEREHEELLKELRKRNGIERFVRSVDELEGD